MSSETEVITCPACRHLLRVPTDWLGQTVQCPECQAKFRAPVRDGDRLTDPVLVAGPATAPPAPVRTRADPLLLLPAFGLMLVGVTSLTVNAVKAIEFLTVPGSAEQVVLAQTEQARKSGWLTDGPEDPAGRQQFDETRAAEYARPLRVALPIFAGVGGLVFYGGLAIVLRRHYRMAQLGCVLATLNIALGCCIPGAIFGLWGLLMLMSDEGREHFRG